MPMKNKRIRYNFSKLQREVKVDAYIVEGNEEHVLAGRNAKIQLDKEAQNGKIQKKGKKRKKKMLNEIRGERERERLVYTYIHTQRKMKKNG